MFPVGDIELLGVLWPALSRSMMMTSLFITIVDNRVTCVIITLVISGNKKKCSSMES